VRGLIATVALLAAAAPAGGCGGDEEPRPRDARAPGATTAATATTSRYPEVRVRTLPGGRTEARLPGGEKVVMPPLTNRRELPVPTACGESGVPAPPGLRARRVRERTVTVRVEPGRTPGCQPRRAVVDVDWHQDGLPGQTWRFDLPADGRARERVLEIDRPYALSWAAKANVVTVQVAAQDGRASAPAQVRIARPDR
jgi:hypothetical protein